MTFNKGIFLPAVVRCSQLEGSFQISSSNLLGLISLASDYLRLDLRLVLLQQQRELVAVEEVPPRVHQLAADAGGGDHTTLGCVAESAGLGADCQYIIALPPHPAGVGYGCSESSGLERVRSLYRFHEKCVLSLHSIYRATHS